MNKLLGLQKALQFHARLTKKVGLKFLLYLPPNYTANDKKRRPLLLFLHGAGERGNDLTLVAKHGPPKLIAQGLGFPFVVVSPQCPLDQTWEDDPLLALLDHIVARYRVDTHRVYLTGLSMGGYGTWSLGVKYPERFAAIAPVCGGGDASKVLLVSRKRTRALKSLPVRAFHGAKDDVVPLAESEVMVTALRRLGNRKVNLCVYPKAGHDSYTETYANPKLYQWLLKQRR
ncbi:MAG TPA: PHB depolymerase family esterase [Verrucomicrobiae bacterium]|nr:PHB depolymerase family esterase [Verrucomicrobiae bacterium]